MPQKSTNRRELSPRQQRDLDIEIGFIEGLVRRDPNYIEALQLLGDDYTVRGRYEEGMKVDEHLARLRPQDPMIHYNLACSYGLLDRIEQSVAMLHRALDLGYRDFKWMRRDPDLRKVRKHALYRQIRLRIQQINVEIR